MRLATWLGTGLIALTLVGCGNRFAAVNYTNMAGYARAVRPAVAAQVKALPAIDIGRPAAMVFDKADNLLVANNKSGSVLTVTSRGEAMEKADNLPDPSSMAVSRSGSVYVSCFSDGSIVRMNNREVKRVAKGLAGPRSVAVTSDESLYITLPASREVMEIQADGTRQIIWQHATLKPELILATAKDELFVSVQDGEHGRLLQISRKGKKLDEYRFERHVTALSADKAGRLLVAAAALNDDEMPQGDLGWLDRNGDWTILAENVVRPLAVAVTPGGTPVYVRFDGSKQRYEIVTIMGDTATPWLAAS
jgi:DNA-binding beta-propeller fold protein YncE